jgi:hypothetical protein
MATIIQQRPLYNVLPVGQDVIFTVSNNTIVATQVNVKFIAEVHISSTFTPNLSSSTDLIGTFKTTPNNAGVGMFDFSSVVENYVKTDNKTTSNSEYKTTLPTPDIPLHLIDKFSGNNNAMKYLAIQFKIEYLGATNCAGEQDDNVIRIDCSEAASSEPYRIFNGYLKHSDKLQLVGNNFGYDSSRFEVSNGSTGEFMTNASLTQYANEDDYGTIAFLTKTAAGTSAANGYLDKIRIECFNSLDVQIGADIDVDRSTANGAYDTYNGYIRMDLLYFGCFPANLRNWSTIFQTQLATGNLAYYSVRGYLGGTTVTQRYIININCPTLKGYVPIRLTWLNQWGAWDYYTFTKKSSRSISTQGSTYSQQRGTWNERNFKISGYKGGKKSFRVNATEKIKMNTDFVSEANGEWFEELINSPEIYMLEGYQTDVSTPLLNQYVTPVRLTTSSYTRKTIANDKLMQYTFEIEKANILRTQAI